MQYFLLLILTWLSLSGVMAQLFLTEQTSSYFPTSKPLQSSRDTFVGLSEDSKYMTIQGVDLFANPFCKVFPLEYKDGRYYNIDIYGSNINQVKWFGNKFVLEWPYANPPIQLYDVDKMKLNQTNFGINLFSNITTPFKPSTNTHNFIWEDLNKDGLPEFISNDDTSLVIVHSNNQLFNNSDWLSPAPLFELGTTIIGSKFITLDYDMNGQTDLLVYLNYYNKTSSPTKRLFLYSQTGNLQFSDVTKVSFNSSIFVTDFGSYITLFIETINVVDFDGDGANDIVIDASNTNYKPIFLRNILGYYHDITGSFATEIDLAFSSFTYQKYWIDFNGDNRVDFFQAGKYSSGTFGDIAFNSMYIQLTNSTFYLINNNLLFPTGVPTLVNGMSSIIFWVDFNNDGKLDLFAPQEGLYSEVYIQGCSKMYYLDQTRPLSGCILCQGTVSADQYGCTSCTGQDYFNSTTGCTPCSNNSIPESDRLSCRLCPGQQSASNGICEGNSAAAAAASDSSSDTTTLPAIIGAVVGGVGLFGFIILACVICLLICLCSVLVLILLGVIIVIVVIIIAIPVVLSAPLGAAVLLIRRRLNKPKPITIEDITLVDLLGSGAFGQVYRGTCKGEVVAVKKIQTNNVALLNDFEHEVSILSKLDHPFVIKLISAIRDVEFCYIITDFAAGGSLDKCQDSLSYEEKIRIIQEISEAMIYLHASGVIHRDISCRNVLLDADRHVKVADFGLSRVLSDPDMEGDQTKTNFGPIRWLPPEFMKDRIYSKSGDVYMYGMMVYELLMNKLPFYETTNTMDVPYRVIAGERPKLPDDWEDYIKDLLIDCWRHDPLRRPNMSQISERLKVDREQLYQGTTFQYTSLDVSDTLSTDY